MTLLDTRTGATLALPYPPSTLAFRPDAAALAVASQKDAWVLFPGGFAFLGAQGAPVGSQVGVQEVLEGAQRQTGMRVDGFELVVGP